MKCRELLSKLMNPLSIEFVRFYYIKNDNNADFKLMHDIPYKHIHEFDFINHEFITFDIRYIFNAKTICFYCNHEF